MNWHADQMHQRQAEILCQAEHDRLVQMALDSRPEKSPGWFGQMMSGFGGNLITAGKYLQSRYETCEVSTATVPKKMEY